MASVHAAASISIATGTVAPAMAPLPLPPPAAVSDAVAMPTTGLSAVVYLSGAKVVALAAVPLLAWMTQSVRKV